MALGLLVGWSMQNKQVVSKWVYKIDVRRIELIEQMLFHGKNALYIDDYQSGYIIMIHKPQNRSF